MSWSASNGFVIGSRPSTGGTIDRTTPTVTILARNGSLFPIARPRKIQMFTAPPTTTMGLAAPLQTVPRRRTRPQGTRLSERRRMTRTRSSELQLRGGHRRGTNLVRPFAFSQWSQPPSAFGRYFSPLLHGYTGVLAGSDRLPDCFSSCKYTQTFFLPQRTISPYVPRFL